MKKPSCSSCIFRSDPRSSPHRFYQVFDFQSSEERNECGRDCGAYESKSKRKPALKTIITSSLSPTSPGERFKPIQPEDRYIIDLTDAQIEDLNDALKDEGYEIYFETERGIYPLASYTLQSLSTQRNRIATTTKLKECWDIARKYAYRSKRPVEGIDS